MKGWSIMTNIETLKLMKELMDAGFSKEEILAVALGNNSVATTPQVAKAEVIPEELFTPVIPVAPKSCRVTVEDLEEVKQNSSVVNCELGAWRSTSTSGKSYIWYGWGVEQPDGTVKSKYPGNQLYYVNDFYLTRDYGAYHPGRTINYKFRDNGANAFITSYKVRHEVDAKDAEEFLKYMADKKAKKEARKNDTEECYTNWCNHSK